MKNKFFSKHYLLCIFLWITVFYSLTSTWVTDKIHFPSILVKTFVVFSYMPFIICIIWKLIDDIKKKKPDLFTISYYAFILYFSALFIYRFINKGDYKETFYITIVFVGSLALFYQIFSTKSLSILEIADDLWIFGLVMIGYKVFYSIFLVKHMISAPLTPIITSSIPVMTIAASFLRVKRDITNRKLMLQHSITLALTTFIVLSTGSRSIFLLTVLVILGSLAINYKDKVLIKKSLIAVLFGLLLIVAFFFDSTIQFNVFRELGISTDSSIVKFFIKSTDEINTKESMNRIAAVIDQTNRSDSMRTDLFRLGVEEFKINPIFGTGHVFYEYKLVGFTVFPSTHNFVIEILAGYGIIGLIMFAVIMLSSVIKCKIFDIKNSIRPKMYIVLIMAYFFGLGLVEAVMFDLLLLPVMFALMAMLGKKIALEEKTL